MGCISQSAQGASEPGLASCQGRSSSMAHSSRTQQLLLSLLPSSTPTHQTARVLPQTYRGNDAESWDDEKRRAKDPPSRRIIKKNALCGRVVPG